MLQGLDAALAKIAKLKDAVSTRNMKPIEMDAAALLLAEFRATAPVVTGRFRDSAFIAEGLPDDPNVLFGIDFAICPYAEVVENGRVKHHMAPRSTIHNAVASTQEAVKQQITDAVQTAIDNALS